MTDTPPPAPPMPPLPPGVRLLQWLVIGLTTTLIVGVIVTVAAVVTRMPGRTPAVSLPEQVKLPAGTTAAAVTFGPGWYAVVTGDGRILIFDRGTGALKQEVRVVN
ncbi:MAG: DUF6476 family protein [Paracoccaceae bacterium]